MNTYDLKICQGASYNISLNLTDVNSTPVNLSGYNISGFVKNRYSDTAKLLDLNPSIVTPESGIISISVNASQTTGLPITIGVYDIEISNGNNTLKVLRGNAYIYPEVTF